MNSAEHREEGLGGDTRPKGLSERVCVIVMERDAEREGYSRRGEMGIYGCRESGEVHVCERSPIRQALNPVGQTPGQKLH